MKSSLTPSQAKREKFRIIGQAISQHKPNPDRDYTTGNESQFHMAVRPLQDKELSSKLGGPKMCSQQWERTVRPKK